MSDIKAIIIEGVNKKEGKLMKVFINPGHHPGVDSGAVNKYHDIKEANVVRSIGDMIEKYLVAAGIAVVSLQSDNLAGENPYYPNVCGLANNSKADLFISLHCNSSVNKKARGTETLVYSLGSSSEKAARLMLKQLVSSLGTVDRGVKERPDLIVLKRTVMPAVLLEIAFISNNEEAELLVNKQHEIARAIARGITDYFSVEE